MKAFNRHLIFLYLLGVYLIFSSCHPAKTDITSQESSKIKIDSIAPNVWVHVSYLETQNFGKVACNGLIFKNQNKVVVIDTPVDDSASLELIEWIENHLHAKIIAVVPTHFHEDCLGGLNVFHERNIPSISHSKTIDSAKARQMNIPKFGFEDQLRILVGNEEFICSFLGAGHTKDNIVAYIPSQNVLFGGCLVKEIGASKGNLADADIEAWPITIQAVKQAFPDVQIIVPGHGKHGDYSLLDYTEELFK